MEQHSTSTQSGPSAFHVPFSLEQLQDDLVTIYLHQLRSLALFKDLNAISVFAGKPEIAERTLWYTAQAAEDYGLSYADIAGSEIACALKSHYEFGFLGRDTGARAFMEMDTVHSYTAAYLLDLAPSSLADQFEAVDLNVSRCLHTCELANARHVLEGGEDFFPYLADTDDAATKFEGALTVRQVALLSGMEEMSVRTAISRKGPNQLPSIKEGRRTMVRIDDAKAWLKAKGLYVPLVTRADIGKTIDLEKTRFRDVAEFAEALNARGHYLSEVRSSEAISTETQAITEKFGITDRYDLHEDAFLNEDFTKSLAEVLEWPPELFALRAKEAVLQDRLNQTAAAVAALTKTANSAPR